MTTDAIVPAPATIETASDGPATTTATSETRQTDDRQAKASPAHAPPVDGPSAPSPDDAREIVAHRGDVGTESEPDRRARLATELALAEANRTLQVRDSHAASTRRAYESDWQAFRRWCERLAEVRPGLEALPASDDTLSLYVGALDRRRPSTVRRAIAAIRLAHERAGYPALLESCPATTAALRGHARRHAGTPPTPRAAATAGRLEAMLATIDADTVKGIRDRAVLLVGFDLAARRSELVGLDVEDLEPGEDAWLVRIRRAKGDRSGEGQTVALRRQRDSSSCPVAALERWLEVGGRRTGPVFVTLRRSRHCDAPGEQRMSDRAVARLVKATAAAAGLHGEFAGHSLRRGLITSALDAGRPLQQVRAHARHGSIDTTLGYAERSSALADHPRVLLPGRERTDDVTDDKG